MSGGRAITIGAFDGVHLGHAELVRQARHAVGDDGRVTALTFEPHPLRVLRPETAPPSLSTFRQRRRWLTDAGADDVIALDPTDELLGRSPESFLEWITTEHRPQFIVEGQDFRFGRGRAGSVDTLRRFETQLGYRTIVVDDVYATLADRTSVRITSSLVRWLVGHGRVRDAATLLGHPYVVCGAVAHGDGRGGPELGVPTANLGECAVLLPADGIYYGRATGHDGRRYPAAVSIGTKPTFGSNPRVCEAHLIGYRPPTDEYGWTMRVELHDWLRDQLAFDSVERLIEQIRRDVRRVEEMSAAHAGGTNDEHPHDKRAPDDERVPLERHG